MWENYNLDNKTFSWGEVDQSKNIISNILCTFSFLSCQFENIFSLKYYVEVP